MNSQTHKPELMAPAGDLACALAAFDAGADAVYAGLGDFNARQRAINFDTKQLATLTAWARQHHRRVYITLNTLIKETELPALSEVLGAIDRICPHAVIVQDLGLFKILRDHFPHLPLHASTQMGTHNSAGVGMLAKLGAQRVIMERQVTLDELALIRQRTNVELEVFVHGALCCGLSGRCLFSSWMGGWSGNRGRCKQPCRRRFFSEDGNGFFFSTQDLYSLDVLDRLSDMGIHALKIEGRLRGPDYVTGVVAAYRKVLDAPPEQRREALRAGRELLSKTGGRKWSSGFFTQDSNNTLIDHQRPGGTGRLCGKVDKVKSTGFTIRPIYRINQGDTLRIQPPSAEAGPALEVTKMTMGNKPTTALRKGQRGFIHCDKEIEPNSSVYIISQQSLDYTDRINALEPVTQTLALHMAVDPQGVTIRTLNTPSSLTWHQPMEIPAARTVSLSADKLMREFARIKQDTYRAAVLQVDLEEGLFLQDKQLRLLRQEFTQWLGEQNTFTENELTTSGQQKLTTVLNNKTKYPLMIPEHTLHTTQGVNESTIKAVDLFSDLEDAQEAILPPFCPEDRQDALLNRIKEAIAQGIRRLRVTALYQLDLLKPIPETQEVTLCAGFPLPACNRFAVQFLSDLGIQKVMLWPEMERESVTALAQQFGTTLEIFTKGRLPLLVTRAQVPVAGRITGGHGQVFWVEVKHGLTYVYADIALSLPNEEGVSTFQDETRDTPHATSDFNYGREWA